MTTRIEIREQILGVNVEVAAANRELLTSYGILCINLMASPGAGKTSLIERTLAALTDELRIGVIDGDIASSIDAQRAEAAGATSVQINTGGQCHLEAGMVQLALGKFDLTSLDLLIIENVGNLICPSSFGLGEHLRVLIASIPEGDDKPYKYPSMYQDVDVLVINKMDLMPYIDFDLIYFQAGVEILNTSLRSISLSCKTGEGIEEWLQWLRREHHQLNS
jgi:hydrogenase nickel incorporation protein HypB